VLAQEEEDDWLKHLDVSESIRVIGLQSSRHFRASQLHGRAGELRSEEGEECVIATHSLGVCGESTQGENRVIG
jgi:hypothetical protein